MEITYITWGMLVALFIVMLFTLRAKEDKATRRREPATDPMFRRHTALRHR
jgi:hypothetical protein